MKLKNEDKKDIIDNANKLEETLSNFGVEAKVVQVTKGPSVTRFELHPSPGVKVSKIVNLYLTNPFLGMNIPFLLLHLIHLRNLQFL